MDQEAEDFLNRNKLQHLVDLFRQAKVKQSNFRYIRENLAELIAIVPSIDDRQAFVEAFDAEDSSSSSDRRTPETTTNPVAPVSIRATLEQICMSSNAGKKFWARKTNKLGQRERQMLSPLITQYFFDIGGGHISNLMFEEMTAIILAEFPNERAVTWYADPASTGTTKASGRLVSSYRTLQGKKRQLEGPQKGAKLHVNTIPFNRTDDIMNSWDECFAIRRHEIMSGSFDMNQYNVLFHYSNARDLITRDFQRINIKYRDISKNIPKFIHKFKGIFLEFRTHFRDHPDIHDEIVKTFTDDVSVNDHSIFLAFYSLPFIIRENFVCKGDKRLKPTVFMSREAFMTLVSTEATIAETREKRKLLAIEGKYTIQPYILAVGSLTSVTSYFVVFDDLLIRCKSCIEAVDLHYKLHDVFNLQYAPESQSVMKFIQKFFFDLRYAGDTLRVNVETLIGDLEK